MDHSDRIQRIDVERHAQGLTIQQLADMCQISASTVSRLWMECFIMLLMKFIVQML